MKQIRYNYYFKSSNKSEYVKMSLPELREALAYHVIKKVCDTPIGTVSTPDYAQIERIIRYIKKGTSYHILYDGYSISIRAEKRGDE